MIRVLEITNKMCNTKNSRCVIYTLETGEQLAEPEFIDMILAPHDEEFVKRRVDMNYNTYLKWKDGSTVYFPWLCSLIANYNFTDEEFDLLWDYIEDERI